MRLLKRRPLLAPPWQIAYCAMRTTKLLLFGLLFFVLAGLSYRLKAPETLLALVWLPTAVAAIIELRFPRRYTNELVLGLLLGALLCHLVLGAGLPTALVRCLGTLLGISGFILAVRKLQIDSGTLRSTTVYCVTTIVFCIIVAASGMAVALPLARLNGSDPLAVLSAWWLANAAAACLVFPLGLITTRKSVTDALSLGPMIILLGAAAVIASVAIAAVRSLAIPYLEISTGLVVAALLIPLFPSVLLTTLTVVSYGAATYFSSRDSAWIGLAHNIQLLPTALMMGGPVLVAFLKKEREERTMALGEAVQALEVHKDHLEHLVKARTAELRAANDDLVNAGLQKDRFLANTSHEMRTPLHAIRAFADLGVERLQGGRLDKVGIYLERIKDNADRLTHFVDNLLNLARILAGKVELAIFSTNLMDLVHATSAELESVVATKSQRIEISYTSIRQCVAVDQDRIKQVLVNLLANASKFSPARSTIRLIVEDDQLEGAPAVRISVVDQGVGIPEEELSRIFESFVQSSRTATGAGGTGLGLSISREIVRLHGGCISASNHERGGACFDIVLPIAHRTSR